MASFVSILCYLFRISNMPNRHRAQGGLRTQLSVCRFRDTKYHMKLTARNYLELKTKLGKQMLKRGENKYCMFGIKFTEAESSLCCLIWTSP